MSAERMTHKPADELNLLDLGKYVRATGGVVTEEEGNFEEITLHAQLTAIVSRTGKSFVRLTLAGQGDKPITLQVRLNSQVWILDAETERQRAGVA